jgi:hypothetical protein
MKDPCVSDADKKKLTDQRHGELAALTAWVKLPLEDRKKTYEAFPLPVDLAKKPITPDYVKNGNVAIKTILTDRCVRCHADEEKAKFTEDFNSLLPFFEPKTEK